MRMKPHYLALLIFAIAFACTSPTNPPSDTLLSYVNPLIGTAPGTTASANRHSETGSELRGQTFPAVGVPFGMTNWTPQTKATEQKCLSPYYYQNDSIQGFRASRWMSGSCTQDYGSVTLMPITGELRTGATERASSFTHDTETATPSYYAVTLDDYGIRAELTGVSHSGMLQLSPAGSETMHLIIEPNSDEGEGSVEIYPERNEVAGYNPVHRIYQGWGEKAGFSGYFVIQFEAPFDAYGVWHSDARQGDARQDGEQKASGDGQSVGAYVSWENRDQPVRVRIGTSFTSEAQARKNLAAEIPHWDFARVRQQSEQAWEQQLSKVRVAGGSEEQKTMFYTALYHSMLLPREFSDADRAYVGFAGTQKVYQAAGAHYYADFSMWDTFRAVHPLQTLLNPERSADMIKSLVAKGEQGGWLPIFPAWNSYTSAMIGDHVTATIGDAWMKGIDDFDQPLAYRLMRKNAFEANPDTASYRNGQGRRAMESYLKYNYVPLEDSVPDSFHRREQVSRTLEYAYDDFVLSRVAKQLGEEADYQALHARAKNYRHVFDTTSGYVRGRHANGNWITPFDPHATRATFITEGSPAQYTWYVPHDVAGLMQLMGGQDAFVQKLDSMFEQRYYWHGNEPGHQMAYLYAYAGAPWKAQRWVRDIIQEEYSATPGGLSGNEDAGQMSAWLAFSMMGFYPVAPGIPCYVLGSPTFDEVSMQVGEGKTFTLRTLDNSDANRYIQSATLNGAPFDRSYLWHQEIVDGGELVLQMGPEPNEAWAREDVPPSMDDL